MVQKVQCSSQSCTSQLTLYLEVLRNAIVTDGAEDDGSGAFGVQPGNDGTEKAQTEHDDFAFQGKYVLG